MLPFPAQIGLIADTHLLRSRSLPDSLIDGLARCDLIFHAGDISRPWVLEYLATLAPVYAVQGNSDDDGSGLMATLPLERLFRCGPHTIGLVHGHDPSGITRMTARVRAVDRMRGIVDWVVYGHSHRPVIELVDGLWMINPGSPTQPRWAPAATWGTLDVRDEVQARLIQV